MTCIPVCRPLLPARRLLIPYLDQLDTSRVYSNFGQNHEKLRLGLSQLFGLGIEQVGLASNGSVALSALVQAVAGRASAAKPLCICPGFTFVATAAAAVEAGYTPYLCDIDPDTWALDPLALKHAPRLDEVGAVIVTAAMGRMIDLSSWQAFSDETGIPVVVDAAAAFDSLNTAELLTISLPIMISLHATKTFSTCEGGLMLCSDPIVIQKASAALNFGFVDDRISIEHGINGKLSEYHASIGLAELDGWDAKRNQFRRVAAAYLEIARGAGLGEQVIADATCAMPYIHFLAEDVAQAERVIEKLDAGLVGWRRWYGRGLSEHPAFSACPAMPLNSTKDLCERLISLPMAVDLSDIEVRHVVELLRSCIDYKDHDLNFSPWFA